jgi:hypothetical protein
MLSADPKGKTFIYSRTKHFVIRDIEVSAFSLAPVTFSEERWWHRGEEAWGDAGNNPVFHRVLWARGGGERGGSTQH